MMKFKSEIIRMKKLSSGLIEKNVEITDENIENLQINQYNLSNQNKEKK